MQRGNIITDLKALIGSSDGISDGQLITWVDDSYMTMVDEIMKVNPDYFSRSSVTNSIAGQQEYALPSDWNKVTMVNVLHAGQWYRVLPMGNADHRFIPVQGDTSSSQGFIWGEPRYYIAGQNIGLMPIPDETTSDAIKIWYTYTPESLSTDTSEPDIPSQYHYILKYGAYANFLDRDDEHVAAERMRQRFDAKVEKMLENISQVQEDTPRRVERSQNQALYRLNKLNSI